MYNINYKSMRNMLSIQVINILLGLFFLFMVLPDIVSPFINRLVYKGETKADNIIVDIGYNSRNDIYYSAIYEYIVDGVKYKRVAANYKKNDSAFMEKDKVFYDLENPYKSVVESDLNLGVYSILWIILGVFCFVYGTYKFASDTKEIKRVKELSKKGVVVKNVKYKLKKSNVSVSKTNIPCIVVEYEVSPGQFVTLKSRPRLDLLKGVPKDTIDLLIDPNDLTNYYIDFDIK